MKVLSVNVGQPREVVITDLTNLAMPFIRYANGDLAVPAVPGTCACGRALPRLASIEGRVTETLIDGTGARVNGLVFNVVIAHLAHGIRQFQVVQHRDRSVTLKVAPTLAYGAEVEVLAPNELRQRIAAKAAETVALYAADRFV